LGSAAVGQMNLFLPCGSHNKERSSTFPQLALLFALCSLLVYSRCASHKIPHVFSYLPSSRHVQRCGRNAAWHMSNGLVIASSHWCLHTPYLRLSLTAQHPLQFPEKGGQLHWILKLPLPPSHKWPLRPPPPKSGPSSTLSKTLPRPHRESHEEGANHSLVSDCAMATTTSQPFAGVGVGVGQTQAYTTPPNSQPGRQHFVHPQYSPIHANPSTPMNQSPTRSQAPNYTNLPLTSRHVRSPKSPLYIPAALRPTDRPQHITPLTPPRSVHGSTDSLVNPAPGHPLCRRSTDVKRQTSRPLTELAEDEQTIALQNTDLPSITGPPTREHWKPDTTAPICDHPICHKSFGLFERRHHCRHCGNVFCNEHSGRQIPLDQDANLNPKGALWRACEHCWDRFGRWKHGRVTSRREESEGERGGEAEAPNTPIQLVGREGTSPEGQKSTVASSVTRDYNWSTF